MYEDLFPAATEDDGEEGAGEGGEGRTPFLLNSLDDSSGRKGGLLDGLFRALGESSSLPSSSSVPAQ